MRFSFLRRDRLYQFLQNILLNIGINAINRRKFTDNLTDVNSKGIISKSKDVKYNKAVKT